MKRHKIIIIGAGIGGITTAIQLAREGHEIAVFEKNHSPGGRCQRIVKDGFTFDTGPTMYLFPEIYADFFSSIGENITDYLTLRRANPTYGLHFSDHTSLTLTSDLESMRQQLEAIEPGSYPRYLDYLQAGKTLYQLAMDRMVKRNLTYPWEYFNLTNGYLFLKHRALENHYGYTKRFFKHPKLQAAFTFQDSYVSLNPYSAPALCSLFTFSEHAEGNFLPEGGMYQVILALMKIAGKYNIKFYYNQPVKEILIKDSRALGIKLADNSFHPGEYVVVNADMTYTYKTLLPKNTQAKKLLGKKYSCSVINFHWGVDKRYPQLKTHNLFFFEPYRNGFDHVIDRPEPPKQTHFYIQASARTDQSRAPSGKDTLSVMVPINRIYPEHHVGWKKYTDHIREMVINRLVTAGLTDIRQHIRFEITYTPPDWQDYYNLTHGAVYGLHHNIMQLGYLRPKREHNKYKNLFFVGADTHPGSGLPTVLLSSQFTTQKILNRIQRTASH